MVKKYSIHLFMLFLLLSVSFLHGEATLTLKATIDGQKALYPGQKTKLVYTYYYNGDIQLVTEKLPLLDAEGFIKIGEKEFKESIENGINVSTISQEIEASSPGTFSFPPSLIEGYVYKKDPDGKRVQMPNKLSSETPSMTLTVLPFPDNNKPASFNGAIGKEYSFNVSLQGEKEVEVGDQVSLLFTITGDSFIKKVPLPDLCCQPGLNGFFRASDLPPVEEVRGNTKTAVVRLTPLNAAIKEIPSIEFSFFNPITATYTSLKSKPIPISIKATMSPPPSTVINAPPQISNTPTEAKKIPIRTIFPLKNDDLHSIFLGSWWALIILPMGISVLLYQMQMRHHLEKEQLQKEIPTSKSVLQSTFNRQLGSAIYFKELRKGLKMILEEQSNSNQNKELITDKVNELLGELDEKQFSAYKEIDYNAINRQVQKITELLP